MERKVFSAQVKSRPETAVLKGHDAGAHEFEKRLPGGRLLKLQILIPQFQLTSSTVRARITLGKSPANYCFDNRLSKQLYIVLHSLHNNSNSSKTGQSTKTSRRQRSSGEHANIRGPGSYRVFLNGTRTEEFGKVIIPSEAFQLSRTSTIRNLHWNEPVSPSPMLIEGDKAVSSNRAGAKMFPRIIKVKPEW